MRPLLLALITLYQWTLSPIFRGLGAECRFHPHCSDYAVQAVKKYPWPRAIILIAKRLMRCHPWHPGGIDPL